METQGFALGWYRARLWRFLHGWGLVEENSNGEIQGSLHCGGKCAASGRDDVGLGENRQQQGQELAEEREYSTSQERDVEYSARWRVSRCGCGRLGRF